MDGFIIRLNSLRFFAFIGVMGQERFVGNDFVVDVSFCIEASEFKPEVLETTVSYADVYDCVKESMKMKWKLLESAARNIAKTIKERWPQADDIHVAIKKLAAPIDGISGNCQVEYFLKK